MFDATHKVDAIDHEPGISISLNLHDTRIRHKLNNLDVLLKELKLYMNDHMKILKSCIYLKIKMAVTAGSCWFDKTKTMH